jgi:hypothetical protein
VKISHFYLWSWRWDSNPQPADYKSAALPIELRQRKISIYNKFAAGSSGSDKKTEVHFINHFTKSVNVFFVFCEVNLLRNSDFIVPREEILMLARKGMMLLKAKSSVSVNQRVLFTFDSSPYSEILF